MFDETYFLGIFALYIDSTYASQLMLIPSKFFTFSNTNLLDAIQIMCIIFCIVSTLFEQNSQK